jgi:uncharacterized membrane protein
MRRQTPPNNPKAWLWELPHWLLLLALGGLMLALWDRLPDRLPLHWNFRGKIDNYGPKYVPLVLQSGIYGLMLVLPLLDPRRDHYRRFRGSYYSIRLGLLLFFTLLNGIIIATAVGWLTTAFPYLLSLTMLMLAFLGNYFTTLKSNWFIGIRTPWTLDHPHVWRRTHALAGRLWVAGGLAGAVLALILEGASLGYSLAGLLALIVLLPVGYSYWRYRRAGGAAPASQVLDYSDDQEQAG